MFFVSKRVIRKLLDKNKFGKIAVKTALLLRKRRVMGSLGKMAASAGLKLNFLPEKIEIKKKNGEKIIISSGHVSYLPALIEKFDNYFQSFVPQNIGGIRLLDFSVPREHMLANSGISFFFSSIPEEDTPFKGYVEKYKPKPADVIFDCGAYCGVTTYFLSKLVGDLGKVYAFEPDEKNYEALLQNIAKHNLSNVIPLKLGLAGKSEIRKFSNDGCLGGTLFFDDYRGRYSQIEIICLTDAYKRFGLSRLDFVKMDIEGAEVEAISGSADFIRNHNIHFAIASYHLMPDGEMSNIALEKIFKSIGYNCQIGIQEHLTTWAQKEEF